MEEQPLWKIDQIRIIGGNPEKWNTLKEISSKLTKILPMIVQQLRIFDLYLWSKDFQNMIYSASNWELVELLCWYYELSHLKYDPLAEFKIQQLLVSWTRRTQL